jgi:hypothetical protein
MFDGTGRIFYIITIILAFFILFFMPTTVLGQAAQFSTSIGYGPFYPPLSPYSQYPFGLSTYDWEAQWEAEKRKQRVYQEQFPYLYVYAGSFDILVDLGFSTPSLPLMYGHFQDVYTSLLHTQDALYGSSQVIPTVPVTSLPYGYPSSETPTLPIRLNTPGKFYINLLTNTAVWSSTPLNPEIWWDAFTPISMEYKDPLYHEISWNPLTHTLSY